MTKTSGSSGALIPMGDLKCALVPLLGGQKIFYYNSAAISGHSIALFFHILENGSSVVKQSFVHVV